MLIPYIGPEIVEAVMADNYPTSPTMPPILNRSSITPIKHSHASVAHLWIGMALRGALIVIALFSLLFL
jgi:quinol-cytochrome oxidoreductase complex cytochrome b subunit